MSTRVDGTPDEAVFEPEESRGMPVGIAVSFIVPAVMLSMAYSAWPDARELDALSRSTSRAPSVDVVCSNGGMGPRATIEVAGRSYICRGVECDRGFGGAPRMVRYDPASPRRCRAEESLGGASSWETRATATGIGGGVIGAMMLATMLRMYLAQRSRRRAFYASQAWRDYVSQRDGGA